MMMVEKIDVSTMELNNVELDSNTSTTNNDSEHENVQLEIQKESPQLEFNVDDTNKIKECDFPPDIAFKKPVLMIGPRRGKIGAVRSITDTKSTKSTTHSISTDEETNQTVPPTEVIEHEKINVTADQKHKLPLPYREPSWGGIPNHKYKVEVLKSGIIINTIDLSAKNFYVIGRLPECDIPLAHPTISRYHAILQYKSVGDEKNGPGYYLYDLESTHGTFWNNSRIRPKHYVKLQGGHMIRFGCSQRKFILQTPPEEEEEESEYSVTELKEMRKLELIKREQDEKERQEQEEELKRIREEKEEAEGIDWGMGEDAEEDAEMTENPYALTTNEELFLDDPKKTLRGWFEREGFDMQYQTEEKGIGQFLCWIELPIDNVTGHPVRAEALVKGKKKESVIQCALEACRILDRQGLLRQATHEGRKRKLRNWEEEDFYDSDEDNFLDRTGTIERKREQRMKNAGKLEAKAETYTSLVKKYSIVQEEMTKIQTILTNHEKAKSAMNDDSNEDALDAFMSNLSAAVLNKADITRMKLQLQNFHKEEESLKKLIDIAKPANLPSLNLSKPSEPKIESTEGAHVKKLMSPTEKRLRVEDKDFEQCLVPNTGKYGLIKKEEVVAVREEEMDESCHVVEMEVNEYIEATQSTKNDEKQIENSETNNVKINQSEALRRKKRNIRKMQHKAEKVAKEVEKGYDENLYREDYSMWVPPENQSGDGKTSLNDKLGY